jgi:photosystem II stability/assembly factor-like uncharacterized protein
MFCGLSRLRLLSVLLPLVLVAPPLGGRLSHRPAASSQSSGTTNTLDLRGVACPHLSTCVAAGFDGTILRSTDGGRTWRRQPSSTSDILDGVACPRPSTCVAVGMMGTIVRSTNGGSIWSRQPSGTTNNYLNNFLGAVACPSPSTCVAVGGSTRRSGTILRSTDGGRTWRSV